MASSQGGKGKTSSQSDKNYWSRLNTAGGKTRRKAARSASGAKSALAIDYGRKPQSKPLESVVFSGQVSLNFPKLGIPPVFVISDGVTIDVQARETDALLTFNSRRPGTFTRVVVGENPPRILASSYR